MTTNDIDLSKKCPYLLKKNISSIYLIAYLTLRLYIYKYFFLYLMYMYH